MKTRERWAGCRVAVRGLAVAALAGLTACATTQLDGPRKASTAFAPSQQTHLGRQVVKYGASHPGESGFLLLGDGVEALAARLSLAERAEKSIDAQYYFILPDITSTLFISRLLDAADRGVRVRLLLDDIATREYDVGMAALDSHPNFEIRIFNPFSRRKGWALDFVTDFGRANRRMHNKSFTVDSQATIVGGRNIGAEYFSAAGDVNFGDLDVLGFGDVAEDVGTAFDAYWNSERAVPVSAVVAPPEDPAAELEAGRARLAAALETLSETPYEAALSSTVLDFLDKDADDLEWAPYQVVYDAPDKGAADSEAGEGVEPRRITTPLSEAIQEATEEFVLVSPYFVPLDRGVEYFRKLLERGVRVVVVTNSLAATDVAAVHAGYAPYRKDLLEVGVEVYEARGDRATRSAKRAGAAFSRASLHAKGFTVDRKQLFVGSFNWDPRSAFINTEMGILVDSPALARAVAGAIEGGLRTAAYRVVLTESGWLRWEGMQDGEPVLLDTEPDASLWRRFTASFLRIFPIEGQL